MCNEIRRRLWWSVPLAGFLVFLVFAQPDLSGRERQPEDDQKPELTPSLLTKGRFRPRRDLVCRPASGWHRRLRRSVLRHDRVGLGRRYSFRVDA